MYSNSSRLISSFSVRAVLLTALCFAVLPSWAFGHIDVIEKAKKLAAESFSPPKEVPKFLRNIEYDAHRDIRFKPEKSLWRSKNTNFDLQFFHPGGIYTQVVDINLHDSDGVHQFPFAAENFSYGKNNFEAKIPADLGYAGFKIYYPLNKSSIQDEIISFVGASYFRAVAKDTLYGLSARGLAIDTGLESGEEFPVFREFWIERPSPRAKTIKIHALLDSKRVTGAYQFIVRPGESTTIDVEMTLFLRDKIQELGIAPLTSMFYYGENTPRPVGEWRPEVHDSDGLLMINGDKEQIWRPLENKSHLRLSQFTLTDPKGFGLFQRDRDYSNYEDLETRMEKRPSAWIVPQGTWGKGKVKLTEIPTNNEFNDNIVAYWIPDNIPMPGESLTLKYQIIWQADQLATTNLHVIASYHGKGTTKNSQRFVIDFSSDNAEPNKNNVDQFVNAHVTVSSEGKLLEQHIQQNPVTGSWRLSFEVENLKGSPLELRAFLKRDDQVLSETWSYLLETP